MTLILPLAFLAVIFSFLSFLNHYSEPMAEWASKSDPRFYFLITTVVLFSIFLLGGFFASVIAYIFSL